MLRPDRLGFRVSVGRFTIKYRTGRGRNIAYGKAWLNSWDLGGMWLVEPGMIEP